MKPRENTYIGWAIYTNDKDHPGLLGRYWWFDDKAPIIPSHMEGHVVALFKTRKLAREYVRKEKLKSYVPYRKAKVVKVKVKMEFRA